MPPLPPIPLLALVAALTLLSAWESRWAPWAPYFTLYAALAIGIPLAFGGLSSGWPGSEFHDHWPFIFSIFAAMAVWEVGLLHWTYETVLLPRLLSRRIAGGRSEWSVDAAIQDVLDKAGSAHGFGRRGSQAIFAAYTLAWAPIGETLLYWGLLFDGLRGPLGFHAATMAVSLLFAARHPVHFLYLWPRVPWPAAALLFLSTFGSGWLNCMLFERTGSLWTLAALHVAMNGLWSVSMALAKRRSDP
jgi:membrane protease YdiL (CAAX protease family)